MMMIAKDGAVKVATGTIKALQSYPILLTLVVSQVIVLGVIAWSVHERNLSTQEMIKSIIAQCGPK